MLHAPGWESVSTIVSAEPTSNRQVTAGGMGVICVGPMGLGTPPFSKALTLFSLLSVSVTVSSAIMVTLEAFTLATLHFAGTYTRIKHVKPVFILTLKTILIDTGLACWLETMEACFLGGVYRLGCSWFNELWPFN